MASTETTRQQVLEHKAEFWYPMKGYEYVYEVSTEGNIRSRKRTTTKGGILKKVIGSHGYPYVNLCVDGKVKVALVHRMVAFTFLGEPPTFKHEVNHKNGIKTDSSLRNLEWVTPHENDLHTYKIGLRKPYNRAVIRGDGQFFKSILDAGKALNGVSCGVMNVLKGRNKTYKGFTFKYAEETNANNRTN